MRNLTRREILSMPYERRLREYEAEKSELFYRIQNLSLEEIARRRAELERKWRI